jgi:hypothetical protein
MTKYSVTLALGILLGLVASVHSIESSARFLADSGSYAKVAVVRTANETLYLDT